MTAERANYIRQPGQTLDTKGIELKPLQQDLDAATNGDATDIGKKVTKRYVESVKKKNRHNNI